MKIARKIKTQPSRNPSGLHLSVETENIPVTCIPSGMHPCGIQTAIEVPGYSLKVLGHSPKVLGHSLKVLGHSPKVPGHSPKVLGHSPKVPGDSPKITRNALNNMNNADKMQEQPSSNPSGLHLSVETENIPVTCIPSGMHPYGMQCVVVRRRFYRQMHPFGMPFCKIRRKIRKSINNFKIKTL